MKWFDRIVVFQMFVYWIFAPLLSLHYSFTTFDLIHIAPYGFCILTYIIVKRNYSHSEALSLNSLRLGDWKILVFIGFAISFLILNDLVGRFVFGEAQLRNANFNIIEAIVYKSIEVGIPLILCYEFSINKKKAINYLTIFVSIISLILISGASKAVFVSVALYYLLFTKKQLGFKSLFLIVLTLSNIFLFIFFLRQEQQGFEEISRYLITRMDGIYLVSTDPLNAINVLAGDAGYLSAYINSVSRFFDEEAAAQFTMGIVGAKPEYLYRLGKIELDATISLPSEMIMIFGYLPGIVITLILLLIARRVIAETLGLSAKPYLSLFGFSIFINLLYLEQSIFSTILNPLKIYPILILLVLLLGHSKKINEK